MISVLVYSNFHAKSLFYQQLTSIFCISNTGVAYYSQAICLRTFLFFTVTKFFIVTFIDFSTVFK